MIRLARPRPGHPYLAGRPMLVAHRGGAGLAPENTLEAFRAALEDWDADMLEMDVRATADGRVVVIHDPTVDRTCDATGAVAALPWDELRRMDAGYRFRDVEGAPSFRGRGVRIPLLDEVLEAFPHARLNVELKEPRAAAEVGRIVAAHGARHRVLIAAGTEGHRAPLRGYDGPWGASARQIRGFMILRRLRASGLHTPGADILQVPESWRGRTVVTPGFIRDAHALNLPVQVWVVDDPDDMRRLLAWGVDGIQTDRPDVLARVLAEVAGRPLPPALAPRAGS